MLTTRPNTHDILVGTLAPIASVPRWDLDDTLDIMRVMPHLERQVFCELKRSVER
jgi:hypothetical protein